MSFTDLAFFIFLPLIIIIHWLTPSRFRWIPLLIASYFFYAFYNIYLLSLILLVTFITYLCSLCMDQAATKKGKKAALVIAAVICLGILFIFKYLDFTISCAVSLLNLFKVEVTPIYFNLLLPVGISFYTFQTLSYVIDVYRGTIKAEKHFGYFALFVVFFPQLVAGPIERPGDLLPQLRDTRKLNKIDILTGIKFLIIGYAQKILIADNIAPFINSAYNDVSNAGGLALIIATMLFAFQIYCDFSGYSLIAIGCARLMGIKLTKNFNSPYLATSIRDFWHRWHITLTTWFTDYLYIPLGGNKKGLARKCLNIFIVFFVSGLWHGANLTFIIWGCLHGIMLIGENLLPKREFKNRFSIWLMRIVTFILVCFTWIFFRSQTLNEAGIVIQKIFTDWQITQTLSVLDMNLDDILMVILCLVTLPCLNFLADFDLSSIKITKKDNQAVIALTCAALTITIFLCYCYILSKGELSQFIYFTF